MSVTSLLGRSERTVTRFNRLESALLSTDAGNKDGARCFRVGILPDASPRLRSMLSSDESSLSSLTIGYSALLQFDAAKSEESFARSSSGCIVLNAALNSATIFRTVRTNPKELEGPM